MISRCLFVEEFYFLSPHYLLYIFHTNCFLNSHTHTFYLYRYTLYSLYYLLYIFHTNYCLNSHTHTIYL